MKKHFFILTLIVSGVVFEEQAVIFNFKGGATNSIEIGIFKNRAKFDDFFEKAGGSKEIADKIERITTNNSEALGNVIGEAGGQAAAIALTAIAGVATGGAGAPAALIAGQAFIVPVFQKAAKFGVENFGGKFVHLGADLIKSASKSLYASHYFENVRAPQAICLGLAGKKSRLIRSKEVLKADKLMDINHLQPMYLVIFSKELVKNKQDLNVIKDQAGVISAVPHVYARPGDILYAGELSVDDLKSSLDITTHFIKEEAFYEDGTPILNEHGKPLVLERTVGIRFTSVDSLAGIECK